MIFFLLRVAQGAVTNLVIEKEIFICFSLIKLIYTMKRGCCCAFELVAIYLVQEALAFKND